MRVSIYRLPEGRIDVMVEASTGNGKAPVVVQNVAKETFRATIGPVVAGQRGRRIRTPPRD